MRTFHHSWGSTFLHAPDKRDVGEILQADIALFFVLQGLSEFIQEIVAVTVAVV
jgi:hypothetical protein